MILPSLASLVFSALIGQNTEDNITLVRANAANAKQPMSVWSYQNTGPTTDFFGILNQCTAKVKGIGLGGNNPVRFAFPANLDGDEDDEVVFLRESKQSHQLQLFAYRRPVKIWDKLGKPFAKSKANDIGKATGQGAIVAAGALDYDGDGDDELMVLRDLTFSRTLEIRAMPQGVNKPMGNPFASDIDFGGQSLNEEVLALFGVDTDGDGQDEIGVLTRISGSVERLLIYDSPASLFADAGAPIASYDDLEAPSGFLTVAAGRIFLLPEARQFVVLTRHNADTQEELVSVYALPEDPGDPLPAPVLNDATPGFVDPESPIVTAFGLRFNPPPPPPPPPDINGGFTVTFVATDALGCTFEIGPFSGANALLVGGTNWQISMAAGVTMSGTLTPPIAPGTTINISNPAQTDQNGCRTELTYTLNQADTGALGLAAGDRVIFEIPSIFSVGVGGNGTVIISSGPISCTPPPFPPPPASPSCPVPACGVVKGGVTQVGLFPTSIILTK